MTDEQIMKKLMEWQVTHGQSAMTSTKTTSGNSLATIIENYGKVLVAKAKESTATARTAKTIQPFSFNTDVSDKVNIRFKESERLQQARLEKEGARVKEKYDSVSDREILKILDAETEMNQCQNCKGFPCKKLEHKRQIPSIAFNNDTLKISYERCAYEKMRRLKERYGLANIPLEYVGKTWEDYTIDSDNKAAVMAAKTFIDKPNKGAYFFGGVGTGKTFLTAIMAQEIIKCGREVVFATVPTISLQIRSTYKTYKNNSKVTESEILEKLYTVPTLVLDDIGIEKPTRFVSSMIANIFNERYNARRQTIITSNYTLEQLEYIFNNPTDSKDKTLDGTRIADRCKQMCYPIELKGNSRR